MNAHYLVLLAAGSGTRAGGGIPKQFRKLKGHKIYIHALLTFVRAKHLDAIAVVVSQGRLASVRRELKALSEQYGFIMPTVVAGGATRFQSVRNGLNSLPATEGYVAIHDGARPLCSVDMINRGWDEARKSGAAIPIVDVVDSLRRRDADGSTVAVKRSDYAAVQTPQIFDTEFIRRAYSSPESPDFTDDASVAEAAGINVTTFQGDPKNIKITHPADFIIARSML